MNYTINANIYDIVDLNYRKKDIKGVLIISKYKKELVQKMSFSISTEIKDATYTVDEIISAIKIKLNLPETVVDIKVTSNGKDLVGTESVTSFGVKFEASFPCKTEEQVLPPPFVEPAVVEPPVVETPTPSTI